MFIWNGTPFRFYFEFYTLFLYNVQVSGKRPHLVALTKPKSFNPLKKVNQKIFRLLNRLENDLIVNCRPNWPQPPDQMLIFAWFGLSSPLYIYPSLCQKSIGNNLYQPGLFVRRAPHHLPVKTRQGGSSPIHHLDWIWRRYKAFRCLLCPHPPTPPQFTRKIGKGGWENIFVLRPI